MSVQCWTRPGEAPLVRPAVSWRHPLHLGVRGAAILLALGGCDAVFQLERGELPDAAPIDAPPPPIDVALANHDEDDDGVDDAIDNCPGRANADQTDGDGDNVGLVCDPNPSHPIDRLRYFSRLDSLAGWSALSGQWYVEGDTVRVPAVVGNQLLILDMEPLVEPTLIATVENVEAAAGEQTWVAGVFLTIDRDAPNLLLGLYCYLQLPSGQMLMFDNRVAPPTTRNGGLPLTSIQVEVGLTAGASTIAVPLCSGRRPDAGFVSVPTMNNNTPVGSAHVGLYSYSGSATFRSVTVFDRKP